MKIVVVLALFLTLAWASQVRYDGYQVYEVFPKTKMALDVLVHLREHKTGYNFWSEIHRQGGTDIMIPPEEKESFLAFLDHHAIGYQLKIANVQSLIEADGNQMKSTRMDWVGYHRLDEIHAFLAELTASYPNWLSVTSAGKSYEGRDMPLLKISTGGTGKKAIFIDGGIHAREWISPAVVTWIINELVTNNDAHPQYLDNIDWYFMPVVNPDGYEYTHTNDRLWRKNRKPNGLCNGVDMNRNFGFRWNQGGSSSSPCSDTYHGTAAFSEIETQNIRDAVLAVAGQTRAHITFHSYGQYFLTPYGDSNELPSNYLEMETLATTAAQNLREVYGTVYTIGSTFNVLYQASGLTTDWAYGGAGIPLTYTIELRDTGSNGFLLPANQIIPTATETWEAVKTIADHVINGV